MNKLIFLVFVLTVSSVSFGAETLTLDAYLRQVSDGHTGLKASHEASEAASLRKSEADLVTAPTFIGNFTWSDDKERNVFFPPLKELVTNSYTLGIQENFSFGLQARLTYNMTYFEYVGIAPGFHEGRPQLELTQSLWKNFFGQETRAQKRVLEASAEAVHYQESFRVRVIRAESEAAYWRLALTREAVEVAKEALDRATKQLSWSKRRAKLQLADRADQLQAEAASELRRLQYTTTQDDERAASRAFNLNRGREAEAQVEQLQPLDAKVIDELKAPAREGVRDDVQAAAKASEAADANADLNLNRASPTVEAFAQLALNSRNPEMNEALQKSFALTYPATVYGVRFSAPIDFGALGNIRGGYRKDQDAAALSYQRRAFEVDQEWTDLNQKLKDARARLMLARTIEESQATKLKYERDRLGRGRTTTYQVLLFEQDYLQSQLSRILTQAEIVQLIARMKLFGSNS